MWESIFDSVRNLRGITPRGRNTWGKVGNFFKNNPFLLSDVSGGVAGIAGVIDTVNSVGEQLDGGVGYTSGGFDRPSYGSVADYGNTVANFNVDDAGKGLPGQTAASFAQTGASIGASVGGPLGAAIGLGAGALLGAGIGALGRKAAKRKAEQKRANAVQRLRNAQDEYNQDLTAFDANQDILDAYNKRLLDRALRIRRLTG